MMTNFEYHEQEIKDFLLEHGTTCFGVANDEVVDCCKIHCAECLFYKMSGRCSELRKEWFIAEHNTYTIPLYTHIDTKVLVSDDDVHWYRRYFSHFDFADNDCPYVCYDGGSTSWSAETRSSWRYCKLWEAGDVNDPTN